MSNAKNLLLPSGTLWGVPEKNDPITYKEAKENFPGSLPTKEQVCELLKIGAIEYQKDKMCFWVLGNQDQSINIPAKGYQKMGILYSYSVKSEKDAYCWIDDEGDEKNDNVFVLNHDDNSLIFKRFNKREKCRMMLVSKEDIPEPYEQPEPEPAEDQAPEAAPVPETESEKQEDKPVKTSKAAILSMSNAINGNDPNRISDEEVYRRWSSIAEKYHDEPRMKSILESARLDIRREDKKLVIRFSVDNENIANYINKYEREKIEKVLEYQFGLYDGELRIEPFFEAEEKPKEPVIENDPDPVETLEDEAPKKEGKRPEENYEHLTLKEIREITAEKMRHIIDRIYSITKYGNSEDPETWFAWIEKDVYQPEKSEIMKNICIKTVDFLKYKTLLRVEDDKYIWRPESVVEDKKFLGPISDITLYDLLPPGICKDNGEDIKWVFFHKVDDLRLIQPGLYLKALEEIYKDINTYKNVLAEKKNLTDLHKECLFNLRLWDTTITFTDETGFINIKWAPGIQEPNKNLAETIIRRFTGMDSKQILNHIKYTEDQKRIEEQKRLEEQRRLEEQEEAARREKEEEMKKAAASAEPEIPVTESPILTKEDVVIPKEVSEKEPIYEAPAIEEVPEPETTDEDTQENIQKEIPSLETDSVETVKDTEGVSIFETEEIKPEDEPAYNPLAAFTDEEIWEAFKAKGGFIKDSIVYVPTKKTLS